MEPRNLFNELSEKAKVECSDLCKDRVERINEGSVEGSLGKIDFEYYLKETHC